MARIRTIKPEAFFSESLAEVSVEAERTFFGLLTQADDHGRHRDNAAIIAGLLWPLRAEHTSVHVEDDLHQLASAGLICRYTGCDGRRYLHIVTWSEHQKIDKPSQSRLPSCPQHQAALPVRPLQGQLHQADRGVAHHSPRTRRDLAERSPTPRSAHPGHLDVFRARDCVPGRPAGSHRSLGRRPRQLPIGNPRSGGIPQGLPEPSPKPARRLGAWI